MTSTQRRSNSVSNSREGFSALKWGPGLWNFIHMAALNIKQNPTPDEVAAYVSFFDSLRYVLPCGVCRREYRKLIDSKPLQLTPETFRSRRKAFQWTVDIHNAVSARLGRPVNRTRDWAAVYEKLRHKDVHNATSRGNLNYKNVINYTQSSRPTIVYLAPRAAYGWARTVHQGRIAAVREEVKAAFGTSVRLLIMDAAKFREVSPAANNGAKYGADSFVIFHEGRELRSVASFPQLVGVMRKVL